MSPPEKREPCQPPAGTGRGFDRAPLTAAVVYTIAGVLPLYLVSAQAVTIQRDLGFGPGQLGLIVSAFFLVSSVAAKRIGPSLDRAGARRGLRLGMALTALACVAIVTGAHRWETLALLVGLTGLANAYAQVGSNLIVAHLVGEGRQGIAFSAKQAAIPASAVVSGLVVPVLGDASWRWPYAVVAVVGVVLLLRCPQVPTPVTEGPDADDRSAGQRITPALLALMVAAFVAGGTGNAMASFTADAAARSGFSASGGALLLTAGSVTAIVVRLAAGVSVDRGRGTGVVQMAVLFAIGVAGLGALSQAGASRGWFVLGLVLTFAGAWGWQGIVAYLALRTIPLPAAASTGAVWSGIYLGTVVVPAVAGAGAARASYATVFLGMSGAMLFALMALLASAGLGRRR